MVIPFALLSEISLHCCSCVASFIIRSALKEAGNQFNRLFITGFQSIGQLCILGYLKFLTLPFFLRLVFLGV